MRVAGPISARLGTQKHRNGGKPLATSSSSFSEKFSHKNVYVFENIMSCKDYAIFSFSGLIRACMLTISGVARNLKNGGHNVQKPSKESGIFQSLSNICFFFAKRQSQKGMPWQVPL